MYIIICHTMEWFVLQCMYLCECEYLLLIWQHPRAHVPMCHCLLHALPKDSRAIFANNIYFIKQYKQRNFKLLNFQLKLVNLNEPECYSPTMSESTLMNIYNRNGFTFCEKKSVSISNTRYSSHQKTHTVAGHTEKWYLLNINQSAACKRTWYMFVYLR